MTKYLVGLDMKFAGVTPSVPVDVVTDLMETLVDFLDEAGFDPDLSSVGAGDTFSMRVEVTVDAADDAGPMQALQRGLEVVGRALDVAGLKIGGPTELQPSVRVLEYA